MNPLGLNGVSLRSLILAYALIFTPYAFQTNSAAAQDAEEDWLAPAWLMSSDQATEYAKRGNRRKAQAAMKLVSPTSADRELLKEYVGYYLSLLTHENNKDLPKDVTDKLLGSTEILNPLTTERAREVMLEDCLTKAKELMTHPSPLVRTNVVVLISQMSLRPADVSKGTPPTPYLPTLDILTEIVKDSGQILQARIPAAVGLERLLRDGSLNPGQRSTVALALCAALDQIPVGGNDGNRWMRWRLASALGQVEEFVNPETGNALVFEKLMGILTNRKESFLARSEAVLAISRLPLGSTANLPLVIHETFQLVSEMNPEYAKNMNSSVWGVAYSRVYLAFRPENAQRAARNIGFLNQIQRPGLSAHSKLVDDAFRIYVPIYRAVWDSTPPLPIPAASEKALQKFLTDNAITDRRPTPTSPPLGGGSPPAPGDASPPVPNDPSNPPKSGGEE